MLRATLERVRHRKFYFDGTFKDFYKYSVRLVVIPEDFGDCLAPLAMTVTVGCSDPAFRRRTESIEVLYERVRFAHHMLLFYSEQSAGRGTGPWLSPG